MRSLVILISGGGSNMTAILQAAERDHWAERYQARVTAVISNQADASGLALAREAGVATAVVSHQAFAHHAQPREAFDAALMTEIDRHQPALVVLAGFMRILTPGFVRHYAGRLVNIHPSLLPAFPGCAPTSARCKPVAKWRVRQCIMSRPNWTTVRSWRRRWCLCCHTTPPRCWLRAC